MNPVSERLPLARPLAFFDLETTGRFPERDRIVEIDVLVYQPDGSIAEMHQLVNPGCPIPKEASDIHHITDDMVKAYPSFASIAPDVLALLEGADLAGYNVLRFDIPMLAAECRRAGLLFPMEHRRVIDPQVIFFQREKRDLSAALKFYCGLELEGAHRAGFDVEATVQVLLGQLARYPDLPASVDELHALCSQRDPSWVDAGGKLVWVQGEACISFGKKAGKSLRWLQANEPDYLAWLMRSDFPADVKAIVKDAQRGKFPRQAAAA